MPGDGVPADQARASWRQSRACSGLTSRLILAYVEREAGSQISEIELPEGRLSCSAGVAAVSGAEALEQGILAAADAALYEAKRDGRDRTRVGRP